MFSWFGIWWNILVHCVPALLLTWNQSFLQHVYPDSFKLCRKWALSYPVSPYKNINTSFIFFLCAKDDILCVAFFTRMFCGLRNNCKVSPYWFIDSLLVTFYGVPSTPLHECSTVCLTDISCCSTSSWHEFRDGDITKHLVCEFWLHWILGMGRLLCFLYSYRMLLSCLSALCPLALTS